MEERIYVLTVWTGSRALKTVKRTTQEGADRYIERMMEKYGKKCIIDEYVYDRLWRQISSRTLDGQSY